jgi:hypothetical protein
VAEGYDQIGTIHHHCGTSAFQSGTDHKDEVSQNQEGIHITFGYMQKDYADFHARVVFRKLMYPEAGKNFQLEDWFEEVDNELLNMEGLPEFPEEWKSRLVEKPRTTYTTHGKGYGGNRGAYSRFPGYESHYDSEAWDWDPATRSYIYKPLAKDDKPAAKQTEFYTSPSRPKSFYDTNDYDIDDVSAMAQEALGAKDVTETDPNFQMKLETNFQLTRDNDNGVVFKDEFLSSTGIQYSEAGFEDYIAELHALYHQVEEAAEVFGLVPEQLINDLQLFADPAYKNLNSSNVNKFFEDNCVEWEETFLNMRATGVLDADNKLIPLDAHEEALATDGELPF